VETQHKAGEYDYNLQTVGVSLPFPFFPFFPHSQFTIDACAIDKTYNFLTRVTFSSLLSPPFIASSSLPFLPVPSLNYDTAELWRRTTHSNDSTRSSRPPAPAPSFPPHSAPRISGTSTAPATFPLSVVAPARFLLPRSPRRYSRRLRCTARDSVTARRLR